MIDEQRIGRMITFDLAELTVDDYATLIGAALWRPLRTDPDAPPVDQFVVHCFDELHAVDPALASTVFERAKQEGAPALTVVNLATRLTQE